MSRRLDIELTSTREDGTWTWRAAGAKVPKGVVVSSLLPNASKVGEFFQLFNSATNHRRQLFFS